MKEMVLAGIVALSASTSLAQTSTAPEATAPAADTAMPVAQQAGGPANLCQELLAFMKARSSWQRFAGPPACWATGIAVSAAGAVASGAVLVCASDVDADSATIPARTISFIALLLP